MSRETAGARSGAGDAPSSASVSPGESSEAAGERTGPEHDYARVYSDRALWDKVSRFAARAGRKVLWNALVLYYCCIDPDTPKEAKVVIAGALGYFIMPLDAISDLFPGGFADDLGALVAALGLVKAHLKPEHRQQAEERLRQWFGDE